MSKVCCRCGEEKASDTFPAKKESKDGLDSRCRDCINAYNRERFKKNGKSEARAAADRRHAKKHYVSRREIIDKIKMDAGCIDCGYCAHPAALQFDHRDPAEKLFRIAGSTMRRMEVLMAEIDKCDVRCANCHAVKTASQDDIRRGRPRKDGTNPPKERLDRASTITPRDRVVGI